MLVDNRLIVALDTDIDTAKRIVSETSGQIGIYKVGPVLWMSWGKDCLDFFAGQGVRVMIDLKFHDIPNTVTGAIASLMESKSASVIWGMTVHASGGFAMMRNAALSVAKLPKVKRPLLFAVTVLTSLQEKDLFRIGINRSVESQVKRLSLMAMDSGFDGVVASAKEAGIIRKACGKDFLILTPGISLSGDLSKSTDQKRLATPAQAVAAGADHLIVGRDIYASADPSAAVDTALQAMSTFNRLKKGG
ncbi:MAG: orotidine-5'-phosphate decarboxylase [Elusimicrobiota bacterium]